MKNWAMVATFAVVWSIVCQTIGRAWLGVDAVILLIALWRAPLASRIVENVVLASAPAVLFVIGQGAWASITAPQRFSDMALKPLVTAPPGATRVVLLIFDELARDVAFEHRPAGIAMPNFDRLAQESFHGLAPKSPAYYTFLSIPAMTMGRPVYAGRTDSPDNPQVRLSAGGPFVSWKEQDTVFDDVARMGENSAVSGWYLPYGRILENKVSAAEWDAWGAVLEVAPPSERRSAWERMGAQFDEVWREVSFQDNSVRSIESQSARQRHIECLNKVWDHGKAMVRDPRYQFVVVHAPVPHTPGIYDRTTRRLSSRGHSDYYSNLMLTDELLGEMRVVIAQSGLAARTHLIVTSDHGVRWRLPKNEGEVLSGVGPEHLKANSCVFFVQVAGSTTGVQYGKPFNTIALRPIVARLLRGAIHTPADIAQFLDGFSSPPTVAQLQKSGGTLIQ